MNWESKSISVPDPNLGPGRIGGTWKFAGIGKIQRANPDNPSIEDLGTIGSREWGGPKDVAFDIASGKIYWIDRDTNKIQRANVNGSSVEDIVDAADGANRIEIALDVADGKIYWSDLNANKIQGKNLDGTGEVEDLFDAAAKVGSPASSLSTLNLRV